MKKRIFGIRGIWGETGFHGEAVIYVRWTKAIFWGVLVGILICISFLGPELIHRAEKERQGKIRQENLVASRGEDDGNFKKTQVFFTALMDGKHQDGVGFSWDSNNWYIAQNEVESAFLAPGHYRNICAAFENRTVTMEKTIQEGEEQHIILDVAKAPKAPELLMLEIPAGEEKAVLLPVEGAHEISCASLPNGIGILQEKDGFALSIDGELLESGFWQLHLISKNQYGYTSTYVGIKMIKEEDPIPIYTPEDFIRIRGNLSGSYIIMRDLDMREFENWKPMGSEKYPFTGVLDGGGHEITGFHCNKEQEDPFSLLGFAKNAQIRNLIFREPELTPVFPRELSTAALANSLTFCLVENCGIFGGTISGTDGSSSGLIGGAGNSILLGLFNSSDIKNRLINRYLPNTGGISGTIGESYVAYCANEGDVMGNHLTGGISGFNPSMLIRSCINSGYVSGSTIVGEMPAGGIVQTTDNGQVYNCYFLRGQSANGGSVFGFPGVMNSVLPITKEDLRQKDHLPLLGSFDGEDPKWAYASLDAMGPVPWGIFKEQVQLPLLPKKGNAVVLPVEEGLRYSYTLDGTMPHPYGGNPFVPSLEIQLKRNQTITVFAARKGQKDSETVSYTWKGE